MNNDLLQTHLLEMTATLSRIDANVGALMVTKEVHETRIDNLDMWRTRIVGAVAGIAIYVCRDHLHTLLAFLSLAA